MDFTKMIGTAIQKAGKQETLAAFLDLAPSALSKRLNGETGWSEKELNKILEHLGCEIVDKAESSDKISTLKKTLKIVLDENI